MAVTSRKPDKPGTTERRLQITHSQSFPSFDEDKTILERKAIALGCVRQFLVQPLAAQTVGLLVSDVGDLRNIALESSEGVMPVLGFEVEDPRGGRPLRYRCNPACLAFAVFVQVMGQSAFVNYTDGRPYLKFCGRRVEKAGILANRAFAGAEGTGDEEVSTDSDRLGDIVKFLNNDPLDLRHCNLSLREHRGMKSGTIAWWTEALAYAPTIADALIPGSPGEKHKAAGTLLRQAWDRMAEERELALETMPAKAQEAAV